jgi:hypothetical protein
LPVRQPKTIKKPRQTFTDLGNGESTMTIWRIKNRPPVTVRISTADGERVARHRWRLHQIVLSTGVPRIYASIDGREISLAPFLLNLLPGERVLFLNGDSLDLRQENLSHSVNEYTIDPETGAVILTVTSRKHGIFRVLVDVEDWPRVSKHTWHAMLPHSRVAGQVYFRTSGPLVDGNREPIILHRFIMNAPEDLIVDHIHHKYLDLRKSELRIVTTRQNLQNQRKHFTHATSRYMGVSWHKKSRKWESGIALDGKETYLGTFPPTPEGEIEAARAYDRKALELFTHVTAESLNFPIEDYQLQKLAA